MKYSQEVLKYPKGNVIIDHLGPWAGPAVCVSAVNTRNTRNFT